MSFVFGFQLNNEKFVFFVLLSILRCSLGVVPAGRNLLVFSDALLVLNRVQTLSILDLSLLSCRGVLEQGFFIDIVVLAFICSFINIFRGYDLDWL